MVNKRSKDKVSFFSPGHPERLRELIEVQEDELQKAERNLNSNMPKLVSEFNFVSEKPGVKYFEGLDGLKKVLNDTLSSTEPIRSFSDIEAVSKYMEDMDKQHLEQRKKLNLKKRVIVTDSKFTKNYLKNYNRELTRYKFIDHKTHPIYSLVEIYDGKVAYISLSEKAIVSMIITNQNIYNFHKSMFEFVWSRAKKLSDKN